jgi:uncharacterized membrane protein YdjX (TVP38/TMEM64 family)
VPKRFFSRYFFWLRDHLVLLLILCLIGLFIPWKMALSQLEIWLVQVRDVAEIHPVLVAVGYTGAYLVITALSVPGPTVLVLNILAGWLFGWWGLPLASFCSSTGALLAFLSSRYLLRESILLRRGSALKSVSDRLSLQSPAVLFACRLNPLLPYFLLNLLYGRSRMPLWQFWLATLIGMIPLASLYVFTGNAMANLEYQGNPLPLNQIMLFVTLSILTMFLYWAFARFLFVQKVEEVKGVIDAPLSSEPPT